MMDRNQIVLLCVGIYMLACIGIGLWAMRRTKSTSDFFMAGRNLGVLITGIAMFSSIMSGFGFVGGPGLVYKMGISSFWIVTTTPIGATIAFYLLGKRIRLFAELRSSESLPDVAGARYDSNAVRLLTSLAILFGVIAYLATQIKAMATVLQDIFARNDLPGHESLVVCVVISCAVLVFYCVTGGIIASVYTDLFQGIVMVVAATLIFLTAAASIDGGFTQAATIIGADDSESIGPWGTLGVFGCLSWFFLFTVGVAGQPHVVTKMMMSRRVKDARFTLPVTLIGYSLAALLWIGIGIVMRALVLQGEHPALTSADEAAPQFLQNYAHPILSGVVFAGLFAAIMSTADGFLNIGAAAVVHDMPRAIRGKAIANELTWARIATVAIAIAAAVFALYSPMKLIGQLGAFGWGVFASALVPTVALGLNWKRATTRAAIASMSAALVINVGVVVIQLSGFALPYGVAGGAVALLTSLTIFIAVSLFSKPDAIDEDIAEVMEI